MSMVPMRDANAPVVNSLRALVIRHCASLTERVGALSALVLSLSEATGPAAQIAMLRVGAPDRRRQRIDRF